MYKEIFSRVDYSASVQKIISRTETSQIKLSEEELNIVKLGFLEMVNTLIRLDDIPLSLRKMAAEISVGSDAENKSVNNPFMNLFETAETKTMYYHGIDFYHYAGKSYEKLMSDLEAVKGTFNMGHIEKLPEKIKTIHDVDKVVEFHDKIIAFTNRCNDSSMIPTEDFIQTVQTFSENIKVWFKVWLRDVSVPLSKTGFLYYCVEKFEHILQSWCPLTIIFLTLFASEISKSNGPASLSGYMKQLLGIITKYEKKSMYCLSHLLPIKEVWDKLPIYQGVIFTNIENLSRTWMYVLASERQMSNSLVIERAYYYVLMFRRALKHFRGGVVDEMVTTPLNIQEFRTNLPVSHWDLSTADNFVI